tara:strand:+ start:1159 stop:2364 length:1206 start_codon:yes stop_codon:yes gene_type:complete
MNNPKEIMNTIGSFTKNKLLNNKNNYILITFIIIFFILFALASWVFNTLSLKDQACINLKYTYKNKQYITSSFLTVNGNIKGDAKKINNQNNYFDIDYSCLIKNYYIKTAYNCCCGDGYKNNFVNKCALENCINLGARCLDFEIYSYNGEPIVAASSANNNSIKETYNFLKLTDVFEILNDKCFNIQSTQCSYDPMFLHFRIMSENKVIYDKMGEYIEKYLNSRSNYLLKSSKYNYKNPDKKDILLEKLSNFKGKFIIMVNTLYNNTLDNSKLASFVNIRSGGDMMKFERYENIIASGNNNSLLIDDSKSKFVMVLPNISSDIDNFDPFTAFNNGCQFIGMKFQTLDNNLQGYFNQFKNYGNYSFILKPYKLRRDIIPPEKPADNSPLNKQRSYSIGGTIK